MKCKECKFRCHTHCQSLVPPSCGLPEDLLQHFMDQLASDGSPILPRAHQHNLNQPPFHSSSSSCNSSTPSSPQVRYLTSVVDPSYFVLDPDPRSRFVKKWFRSRIRRNSFSFLFFNQKYSTHYDLFCYLWAPYSCIMYIYSKKIYLVYKNNLNNMISMIRVHFMIS